MKGIHYFQCTILSHFRIYATASKPIVTEWNGRKMRDSGSAKPVAASLTFREAYCEYFSVSVSVALVALKLVLL